MEKNRFCYNGAAAALCLSVQANYMQEFPERAHEATLNATTAERNREMVTSVVECTQESEKEKALKGSDFWEQEKATSFGV